MATNEGASASVHLADDDKRRCSTAVGVAAEVKSRLQIADVVGETVQLKKAGTTFKGLCPFHGEKTPSFVVTPARESWKCFGCGLGGDVFSFVMQRDSVSFPEALKSLAARAGVELDERTARDDARKARLRDVLETAIAWYHVVLTSSKTGRPALDYLHGRGFTDETISRFQLGWAPGGWDTMSGTLAKKRQIRAEELAEVGLTSPRQGGRGGAYDRFRERIIFPIRDQSGGAVGLGGRYLIPAGEPTEGPDARDRGPKYLNSPGTVLFDKSRTLYLIDKAKGPIRKGGQAVIVEGYTDALMAHQAGFDNVIASLGTALTPGQVALVVRYAKRIALAYDVDPAGQSAGTFGVTELNALIGEVQGGQGGSDAGIGLVDVGVVRLPDGKDPDEVIREQPDLWREATRTPVQIMDYLINYHAARVDVRTPEGKERLVAAVLPTLRRVGNPTVRDSYLRLLAQRSTVDERTLLEQLHQAPRGEGVPGSAGRAVGPGRPGDAPPPSDHGGVRLTLEAVRAAQEEVSPEAVVRSITPVEQELLRLMLLVPDQQARVAIALRDGGLQLPSTVARELYAAIVHQRGLDGESGLEADPGSFVRGALLDALDPETRALAIALYARPGPDPVELPPARIVYAIDKLLITLEQDQLEDQIAYTQAEQADAELRGDPEAMRRLLDQERQYHEARRSLDRRAEQTHLLSRTPIGGRS
ncbi:MAG TPA: DNA primase [Candidatus Limnocylindrales bacterium]